MTLDNIPPDERENIKLLVMNVGSVNFVEKGKNDIEQIYEEYTDMLEKVTHRCPNADVIVSSIIPRRGDEGHDGVNKDIKEVNDRLFETCKDVANLHFCNNAEVVLDEFNQIKNDLYKDVIHLNPSGRKDLARSIFKKVKEVYFERKMCLACAKVVCTSPNKKGEVNSKI